jgi:hypothetical protein
MKEDLRNVTHSFALHALRQTPNKVPTPPLIMCIILLLSLFFRVVDPDPNGSTTDFGRQDPGSHCKWGSVSRRAKITRKNRIKRRNHVLKGRMFFLFSLDFLRGGLSINK